LLGILAPPILRAQGTSFPLVQTSVDPTSGTIGDRLHLVVEATVPDLASLGVLPLDLEETTWTLEGEPNIKDADVPGGKHTRTLTYTIIPFATGRLTIPRIALTYAPSDGSTSNTVLSEPLWVDIDSVLNSELNLREALPPAPLPIPKSAVWTGLIILFVLLALLAFWLWRRYSERLKRMLGGPIRPDELALKQITQLEDERLIEQKKIKEFYTRLADSLRQYLMSAYGVHATDLTTTELLRELDHHAAAVPPSHTQDYKTAMARLTELLDEADLVKFARLVPEASQCRRALQGGRDIVSFTRYRFLPEEEPSQRKAPGSPAPPAPPRTINVAPPPLPPDHRGGEQ
jgi:hypothetical protein